MRTRKHHIAAENNLALRRKPGAQRVRKRTDRGDHHHTQRQAGDEDPKAVKAAAKLAQPRRMIVRNPARCCGGRFPTPTPSR